MKVRQRKYKVELTGHVYCSSGFEYFAESKIFETDTGMRYTRLYDLGNKRLMYRAYFGFLRGYPRYLEKEIRAQLKDLNSRGEIRVFEMNKNDQRRYKNLRYHVPDRLENLIGRL